MAAKCPRCRGTKFVGRGKGRKPCPACTAGAVGDKVVGAAQRAADRIVGRSLTVDGRTTTSRTSRFGTETTRTRMPKKRTTTTRTRKTAAAPAVPVMPACDRCGTRGPLTVTSRGAYCATGCTPR
ncbi:hypothetical protein Ga0074812_1573 [Parafrankia irregularis]|uniref:Uncharacterized protein n=1 Tax=Parafrankia irregularis TaxID=795642 RepID=A0A0S4R0R0_9ACTN|nr:MULTISPECIES: hypothetical protein [Parafrankia]MBE3206801.1 hypothetical protein [Parafrankia sp. CH37]MBE3206826.1 hypothetical protein [Parafrankia sp. CH37]CUU61113.1 hypothetical protein Ga0074812_1573 [Parafrankia irregularis]